MEEQYWAWDRLLRAHLRREVMSDEQRADLADAIAQLTDDPELNAAAEALVSGAYEVEAWVASYSAAKHAAGDTSLADIREHIGQRLGNRVSVADRQPPLEDRFAELVGD